MVAPALILAGASALIPLIEEALRDKPDASAAKTLLESKRGEMIDKAIGGGMTRQAAEAAVDKELQAAFAEADRQGSFNTPVGEMLMSGLLGGGAGWAAGKAVTKFGSKGLKSSKLGKWITGEQDASKVGDKVSDEAAPRASTLAQSEIDDVAKQAEKRAAASPFPGAKTDIEAEFAGMKPMRGAETVSSDVAMTPFPMAPRRGPQTLQEEFGIAPPYGEMDLRREFGADTPIDRIGLMRRLRMGAGD